MGAVRLLLACSVVIEHCKPSLGFRLYPGQMAVEMFFIVSGFYMSLILTDRYSIKSCSGQLSFYTSRFFRLWPTFLLTVLATYILWLAAHVYLGRAPTSAGDFRALIANDFTYGLLQFSNIFMIGQDIPSIFHVSPLTGPQLTFGPASTLADGSIWMGFARDIWQAWSIGTEIWFYLLVPALIRLPSVWLAILSIGSLLLRASMDAMGYSVYFFFPTQLALFLFGILAHRECRATWLLDRTAAVTGLTIICMGAIAIGSMTHFDLAYRWILYAIFAITMPAIFNYSRRSLIDRSTGELSYPIYITHLLVSSVLVLLGTLIGVEVGGEVVLVATIIVSWLIYTYVDKPISIWRERFARREL